MGAVAGELRSSDCVSCIVGVQIPAHAQSIFQRYRYKCDFVGWAERKFTGPIIFCCIGIKIDRATIGTSGEWIWLIIAVLANAKLEGSVASVFHGEIRACAFPEKRQHVLVPSITERIDKLKGVATCRQAKFIRAKGSIVCVGSETLPNSRARRVA